MPQPKIALELVLENWAGGELDRHRVHVATAEDLNSQVVTFVKSLTLSPGDVLRIEGEGEL